MAGKQTRNANPSNKQPMPHRQQTAVRVAASNGSTLTPKHQINPEVSTTNSQESTESSDISTATNISSRISKSKFAKNEELPRKCLVVRRSAPKQGVTKTEIRLVIYNETQKKEGLRKMEYPALMDASEMLADRLRDLETKSKKDGYDKEREVRRELEGERRPVPTPEHEKAAIARLKKVAPSLCNPSDVTTASQISEPQSASSPNGSIAVSPSKKPRRKRDAPAARAPPTTVSASTTVISDKDLDELISSAEKSEPESKSKSTSVPEDSQKSKSSSTTPIKKKTPKKDKKKKRKRSDAVDDSEVRDHHPKQETKDKSAKPKKQKVPVPASDSDDSAPRPVPAKPKKQKAPVPASDSDDSAPRPVRSKKEPAKPEQPESDDSEVSLFPSDHSEPSAKPLRKPPPHAIRERKDVKNKPSNPVAPWKPSVSRRKVQERSSDPVEPSEPRRAKKEQPEAPKEPKEPVEPSEPRRAKKGRDQPKDEEPKGPKEPQEPAKALAAPLCDRRDCCMQQPCVKKDRKTKDPESDQPTLTEKDEIPSGKRGKKKNKKRTEVVLRDDTTATNNSNVEDSLYVLKRIHKKLDSSNSIKLKNNPDKEKVKAQLEKIISAIEGKLANGTKLNADDLDRMKRIVAKTAELRGTVSLTTTVTVTESVSVEDEDSN